MFEPTKKHLESIRSNVAALRSFTVQYKQLCSTQLDVDGPSLNVISIVCNVNASNKVVCEVQTMMVETSSKV